jgi:hypothetical protein
MAKQQRPGKAVSQMQGLLTSSSSSSKLAHWESGLTLAGMIAAAAGRMVASQAVSLSQRAPAAASQLLKAAADSRMGLRKPAGSSQSSSNHPHRPNSSGSSSAMLLETGRGVHLTVQQLQKQLREQRSVVLQLQLSLQQPEVQLLPLHAKLMLLTSSSGTNSHSPSSITSRSSSRSSSSCTAQLSLVAAWSSR